RPATDALDREERRVVARRPAPGGFRQPGFARPDRTKFLGLQSGLCPGPERACLGRGVGRYHARRVDAAGGGGEGVQAGRGDLCEIPDRASLREPPERTDQGVDLRENIRQVALTASSARLSEGG